MYKKLKKQIIEGPCGCVDIRYIYKDGAFQMKIAPSTEHAQQSELSDWYTCIGIRLFNGVRLKSEEKEKIQQLKSIMIPPLSLDVMLSIIEKQLEDNFLAMSDDIVNDIIREIFVKRGCIHIGNYKDELPYSSRYIENILKKYGHDH